MVSIALYNSQEGLEKKLLTKWSKWSFWQYKQSTPLMVPILPTQLGHVWCRLLYNSKRYVEKKL
jgi:hypothetical protein